MLPEQFLLLMVVMEILLHMEISTPCVLRFLRLKGEDYVKCLLVGGSHGNCISVIWVYACVLTLDTHMQQELYCSWVCLSVFLLIVWCSLSISCRRNSQVIVTSTTVLLECLNL